MATADQILKSPPAPGAWKAEFAWSGNLTQLSDSAGARVCAMSGSIGNPGFPTDNLISGSNVAYNPMLDQDNNWWGSNAALPLTVSVGFTQPVTFNQVVVYLHPTKPTCTAFNILAANGGPYTTLYSGTGLGTKVTINLATPVTATVVDLRPQNKGSDGWVRVVAIELYNWVDETALIIDHMGTPDVALSAKGDGTQNAIPGATDLQIVLNNIEKRFSPTNTSSPIYGLTQVDGEGSGVRAGARVRLTASATSSQGSFSLQAFYGFIANDDNPGGADGVAIDGLSGTATFTCKSIYAKLSKTINVPVYEGAAADYIIKDICARSGIAQQDLNVPTLTHGVPYLAFAQNTGVSMLAQLSEALPFLRIYETFDPDWKLNVVNYGRMRTDIDIRRFETMAVSGNISNRTPKNTLCIPSLQRSLFFDTNRVPGSQHARIYLWDMTMPLGGAPAGDGMTLFGTSASLDSIGAWVLIGTTVYLVDTTGAVSHFDGSATTLGAITADGTFSGIDAGFTFFKGAVGFGNFIYVIMSDGAGFGNRNDRLYVWDTTLAFATRVSKGVLAHALQLSEQRGSATSVAPSALAVDGTYLFYKTLGSIITISIWKHNGTPYATALAQTDVNIFSAVTIAGENYTNHAMAYSSTGLLGIVVAVSKAGGPYRQEIWTLDIAAAFATPAINATKRGIIKDDTSALAVFPGGLGASISDVSSMVMNGTYLYFTDTEMNAWVWDTAKDFSFLFQIGFSMTQTNLYGQQTPSFQHIQVSPNSTHLASHIGPICSSQDHTSRIWYAWRSPTNGYGFYTGFNVQGGTQFSPTPSATFSLTDNFVENLLISRGNPLGNRVVIQPAPFAAGSVATLWSQSADRTLLFPSNTKTTLTIPLSGVSWRGYGAVGAGTFRRLFQCAQFLPQLPDDPTVTTTVTINTVSYDVTFFCYADVAYLIIDAVGKVGAYLTSGFIGGVAMNQPLSNVALIDRRDDTSFRVYNREFVHRFVSPAFNDPSFFQDVLLMEKYGRPYVQAQNSPFYPALTIAQILGIADPEQSMIQANFELVEYSIQGFHTSLKAKKVFPTFTI